MSGIPVPTINLNGTDGKELLSQVENVVFRLTDAIGALMMACPHGRDYPNKRNEDSAYPAARKQNESAIDALCKMRDEYRDLAEEIQNQIDARTRGGR
jgi:hypothetical protein